METCKMIEATKNCLKNIRRTAFIRHRQSHPDVYILMRLFCPKLENETVDYHINDFLNYVNKAFESIKSNGRAYWKSCKGKTYLIINDDTERELPEATSRKYINARNNKLNEIFATEDGVSFGKWIEVDYEGHQGSAYAAFKLKKYFTTKLEGQKPDDIAIFLDQDDALDTDAIINISKKMKKDGIVISAYKTIENGLLDISEPKRHNKHTHNLAKNSRKKRDAAFFSVFSSIGWTKSYSRSALTKFVDDLDYFLERRGGAQKYFCEHQYYEDFIDFYALMFSDTPITGVSDTTHIYHKNAASITSQPNIEAFRNHRTAHLITLIDLCYAHGQESFHDINEKENRRTHDFSALREDYKTGLLRFVTGKVVTIENIINQYIDGYYKEGCSAYMDFATQAHNGYFISKLSRLALGENRSTKQDEELFKYKSSRTIESGTNFSDLFSAATINVTPGYKTIPKHSTPRYALRKAVDFENGLKCRNALKECWKTLKSLKCWKTLKEEDQTTRLVKKIFPPHGIPLIGTIIIIVAIIGGVAIFAYRLSASSAPPKEPAEEPTEQLSKTSPKESTEDSKKLLLTALISITSIILTYFFSRLSQNCILSENELSLMRLYYSEFQDLIRHIEANVKIMAQIRKDISAEKHSVQSIHFENLKWPESSCLLSDEVSKIITKTLVDDYTRLKVNIRNINNSAEWLKTRSESTGITTEQLDWEITRYIGYLINFYYMREHDFEFPNPKEMDLYIHEKSLVFKLTKLFMDYNASDREKQVRNYINRYLDDRRMKRSVLVD